MSSEPPTTPRRWDRPDASMSLLADLFAGRGLDPGYAEAARRPNTRSSRGARLFAAAVVIGLLGAVAVIQTQRAEPVAQRRRAALAAQIRERTAETDGLRRRLDTVRARTERLRRAALARSEAGKRVRSRLDRLALASASTPVTGSALVVTVDDADGSGRNARASQEGRIYDRDLQHLVNALWAAKATAIGINGRRLTATTAIRSAGDAVLVDYRPLSRPYVVTAVGDPDEIEAGFVGSKAEHSLASLKKVFGIRFDVHEEDEAHLPAASVPVLRYAHEGTTPR